MIERDTWLYGDKAQTKIAKSKKGRLEPSSDETFRYLIDGPAFRQQEIIHRGQKPGDRVTLVKAKQSDPPPSRQLRDPFTTYYVQGIALEPPLPPDRLLNLTEENPLHSACLVAKATDACGRGWSFEPLKEGDQDLIDSDVPEKLTSVMEDLTPDLTFGELLFQAAFEMDAIGWGVWECARENGAVPGAHPGLGALYPLPAHTVRASLDPRKWVQIRAGRVRYFKRFGAKCTINNETGEVYDWSNTDESNRARALPPELIASEVIVFRSYTPRSLWYGVPRWVSCVATIAELAAIREFNVSWFASGGQVDYVLHFTANDADAAKRMKEEVEHQIRENAGRGHTKLFTYGDTSTSAKSDKLGETLREGHFRFRRGDLIKEVLIAHSVPPYRVGWAEQGSLGGSAAHEMLGAYKYGAIAPIQAVMEDRLRATIFNPETGIDTGKFRLRLREFNFEDRKEELQYVIGSVTNALMTPNQARDYLDMDVDKDKKELDVYYFRGLPLGAPGPAGQPSQPPGGTGPAGPGDRGAGAATSTGVSSRPQSIIQPGSIPVMNNEDGARGVVLDMIARYEEHLRKTLSDDKPPRGKQPQRVGLPDTILAGPARDDKPNVASRGKTNRKKKGR